jgi:subtilisin family serine protease
VLGWPASDRGEPMSFRSVSLLAVGGLVIATFVASAPTSAAPSTAAPTPGAAKLHFGTHRSWPGSHVPSHGKPPRPARTTAPARIPHLDPRLQTAPPSRDGTIEVTLRGDARALPGALAKVGGRSIASVGDAMSAVVPRSALATLAGTPGVRSVEPPLRAYPDVTSEGVAASNANVWQSAGKTGQNVKVGIVDVGFAILTAEKNAGRLPANTILTDDCGGDPNLDSTDHGTAVAEIVHQMAPAAQLYLYCIADNIGFAQAEGQIETAGDIKIVNSSLGFPGDSRGDGTGGPNSAAATVQKARQAGILWIQSAGNNGEDHWSGTLQDVDADGLVDLNGTRCDSTICNEGDGVFIPSGQSALLVLKWDDWPTVLQAVPLTFEAFGWQCVDAQCSSEMALNRGQPITATQQANTPPVLAINVLNDSAFDQEWDVYVQIGSGVPQVGYDLSYWGAVSQSYLASVNPGRAAAGSITEPADSPFAFAVGAANWQGCGVEPFSSRGPTIDNRIKPDITGFDGVSSNLADLTPFYGTSAAAPHVAGAAAIVAAAKQTTDPAQIEDSLNSLAGTSPPLNTVGHGVLNLGGPQTPGQPAVTRVNPASSAVGTTVTISGNGFLAGATTVRFGGVTSHHVTVSCVTRLVASVPAASPTTVPVTVATASGTSATTSADQFTYRPLVTAAVDPKTKGYWLATPQGNVYQFGAPWYGSKGGVSLPAPIVGMAADPATGGYWMVTSKGNVYNFNAPFYGSMAGKTLPAPIVSITSSGHGYLLTTSKGNVYNFNAPFYGSMAGKSLPAPISGVAADPATGGYWLTTTKGNVYNFNAPWYGSAANTSLPASVVTIDTSGAGYLLTTSAGNVLHYNATYFGSPADRG